MSVLVDSSVWSLAFRRQPGDLNPHERAYVREWERLVREGDAEIIGLVRQEVLSGIRLESHFRRVEEDLSAFPSIPIEDEDYIAAARFYNVCRARGISATPVDMLICAVSCREGVAIFTSDGDFTHYANCLPISLHKV